MRRRLVRWGAAGTAVAALAVTVLLARDRPGPPVAPGGGQQAPSFRLPDLADPSRTISLEDFRGRPLVLNFWASWCAPCRKELPDFQKVHEKVGDRVAFLGIDHQDVRDDALELLRRVRVDYPSAYDPEGKTAVSLGVLGMPSTLFIAPDGRVVGRQTGPMEAERLAETIDRLFVKGAQGP